MENSKNGIKLSFGAITVDSVKPDQFKDGLGSAQIRQIVTKTYPAASVGNSMQDSLFGAAELGIEDGKSFDEKRITWIAVPLGTTEEQVGAHLAKYPNARIYKVLSMEPILTDGQEYAIEAGLTDLETIANKQIVCDSEGTPALFNGEVQYSAKFFSLEGKADEDRRPAANATVAEEVKSDDLAN